MKTLAQGFKHAAQELNPGSRSRESKVLPLSTLQLRHLYTKAAHPIQYSPTANGHNTEDMTVLNSTENRLTYKNSVSVTISVYSFPVFAVKLIQIKA